MALVLLPRAVPARGRDPTLIEGDEAPQGQAAAHSLCWTLCEGSKRFLAMSYIVAVEEGPTSFGAYVPDPIPGLTKLCPVV
jgi:hypothetical protein